MIREPGPETEAEKAERLERESKIDGFKKRIGDLVAKIPPAPAPLEGAQPTDAKLEACKDRITGRMVYGDKRACERLPRLDLPPEEIPQFIRYSILRHLKNPQIRELKAWLSNYATEHDAPAPLGGVETALAAPEPPDLNDLAGWADRFAEGVLATQAQPEVAGGADQVTGCSKCKERFIDPKNHTCAPQPETAPSADVDHRLTESEMDCAVAAYKAVNPVLRSKSSHEDHRRALEVAIRAVRKMDKGEAPIPTAPGAT